MIDRKSQPDPNETPEDVATLYSWANLHGAKYRDFSASRAQTREKARQRVQEAMEAEQRRTRDDAETAQTRAAAPSEPVQQPHGMVSGMVSQEPAEETQRLNSGWQQQAPPSYTPSHAPSYAPFVEPAAPPAAHPSAPSASPAPHSPYTPSNHFPPAQPVQNVPPASPYSAPAYPPQPPVPGPASRYSSEPVHGTPLQPHAEAPRAESNPQRAGWPPVELREALTRPAWLTERAPAPPAPAVPRAPEDTLQGSRDRLTSRWFALKGVFAGGAASPAEIAPAPAPAYAPVLAVFSLAGGVGKTSLVATLGRALSSRGERVLLVDTAAYGLLPFFFGARDQRPGVLRTFTPPGPSADAPIQMLTVDPDTLGPENAPQEPLSHEITRNGHSVSRVLIDLATASGATTRRVLRLAPTVLVPLMPDMSSVVSVGAIDSFFQHNAPAAGQPKMPYYVLNQFDPSLPLHLDVREVLREQLGDRLLPFVLRRTPAVSEALAEGMTVMDYAPSSTVADDFGTLAGWVKSLAAPASNGFRGVRWSER